MKAFKQVRKLGEWIDFNINALIFVVAIVIAVGTCWNAYENHIANEGVHAWAQQMGEMINQGTR